MTTSNRQLEQILRERILVLDGAMGTAIQARDPGADAYGGEEYVGCNEWLVRQSPSLIREIHEAYLDAGADIIETDTFGATRIVLEEYGLGGETQELNREAALIAREAADRFATPERPRFVAGSIGPTTKSISVTGGIDFDGLRESFFEQASGLLDGGVDLLIIETQQDTLNAKAAILAALDAMKASGHEVPISLSVTIEQGGTMLAGQRIEALHASVMHFPLLSIGLNCATGPEFMMDHLRSLAARTPWFVSCYPNAGLPNEHGAYPIGPDDFTAKVEELIDAGHLNLVGGCCGTTPEHIRKLVKVAAGKLPRRPAGKTGTVISGIDLVEPCDDNRPLLVGERTNVLGSRRFKRLIRERAYEEAASVGRRQVAGGAQILDVCLQDPDADEVADLAALLDKLVRMVKAPIMIDSTDEAAVEAALKRCQGRAIINSVNLEDGGERLARISSLASRYGAALVAGCIDEDPEEGMAITTPRKVEVAGRIFSLLTKSQGIPPEAIIWDPLVFPCGTGDAKYQGSAIATVEAIPLLKREFPGTHTILGISNVSFGLPQAGREILNSVFLYLATKAGLDFAIVNTERLARYAAIPEEERTLCEELLRNIGSDPIGRFADHFRNRRPSRQQKPPSEPAPALTQAIVTGSKDGLVRNLDRLRQDLPPIEIINGPLMEGMKEVGRLFNRKELIVAEVLQSAGVMKAAVTHLERFMDKEAARHRGTVLLATVKGDVHDIGKNLVEIILKNNGYKVVDLGIKVAPDRIIEACREEKPDLCGLSGLLVKSAHQMVATAEDMRRAGISVPLLVGGAALTERFTGNRIASVYGGLVRYASDAMQGLDLANAIIAGECAPAAPAAPPVSKTARGRSTQTAPVNRNIPIPPVPDTDRHLVRDVPLEEVFDSINPQMLLGRHLGLKGKVRKLLEAKDEKAVKLWNLIEQVKKEALPLLQPAGVYRFMAAESEGDVIKLYENDSARAPVATLPVPRSRHGRCLADYVLQPRAGHRDHLCLFVVTAGSGPLSRIKALKESGDYLRCHALQALWIETAEALAEWIHRRLREDLGFPDPAGLSMQDLFKARYRGKRYSFGYGACPDLALQRILFNLLSPEEIGVRLTEGDMMDPEASVSALVFHHPEAVYFQAG